MHSLLGHTLFLAAEDFILSVCSAVLFTKHVLNIQHLSCFSQVETFSGYVVSHNTRSLGSLSNYFLESISLPCKAGCTGFMTLDLSYWLSEDWKF